MGLYFSDCDLIPESAAHLSRLIRDAPRLSTLLIYHDYVVDAVSAPVLAAALRVSSLVVLCLEEVNSWRHEGVGSVLIDALVGHPTLQEIMLPANQIQFADPQNTVGACLARLIVANSPGLHTLSLAYCFAGDDALWPVFAALAFNTCLPTLHVQCNKLSAPFARNTVLPSLRTNTALRKIVLVDDAVEDERNEKCIQQLLKAEALVAARR